MQFLQKCFYFLQFIKQQESKLLFFLFLESHVYYNKSFKKQNVMRKIL